ncbi:MAG: sodium-translocating pyrophosphatase [Phycisphaerae bacterium]|nr:sodium-translocating pyrophosphatase [Phycisphaerae bacterium]
MMRLTRWPATFRFIILPILLLLVLGSVSARASEADLRVPDLNSEHFFTAADGSGGIAGGTLLMFGLAVCVAGLAFGLVIQKHLRQLPVHRTMSDVSETIYTTCKTYLQTQGKFILLLELFIGAILIVYFGFLAPYHAITETPTGINEVFKKGFPPATVATIIIFSLIGIAGSYMVAWFGIRVNTYANSRTALASLAGTPYPVYAIPLKAGMSIGMVLISVELFIMLCILLFIPGNQAGPCFIGFAVGESLGAAALRVAGGIFTKIADIGADLMKIVFNVKEDDARNPGVIADCVGDNAGDSVGPTADGFETYGVTGVALITYILLAMPQSYQVPLLVWIFVMRLMMIVTSGGSYLINEAITKARYGNATDMDFEAPLTSLVILTSLLSIIVTYLVSFLLIRHLGDGSLWWRLSTIISCGTAAGAIIPELTKVFTSTHSRHVRECVNASREGGASLNVLSGLTAGNFSAFWLGLTITALMAIAYGVAVAGGLDHGVAQILKHEIPPQVAVEAIAVFAFGLVAFGFLGMGPVTIAVDSYGPVTDNAQSVYELSLIEQVPDIANEVKRDFNIDLNFERAKHLLEENDGAGNTFKATAKPVLIGTAVVGATTMIFSIIMVLTQGLTIGLQNLSILHAPFLLGIVAGGAVIYWFSGASMQAVVTGAYRAVEFIKQHMRLDSDQNKASIEDSKKVVEICTKYAQAGMFNVFLAVFFITLSFACLEPYFFIGFLISLATFGLFQAIFMANAGGAWDNAKKVVEVELREKGTPLHAATVVGDTVGDPFKDTSSVAMNPIIKFTTLFGLLAVELSESLRGPDNKGVVLTTTLSAIFFLIALAFVYRSFYGMRIKST